MIYSINRWYIACDISCCYIAWYIPMFTPSYPLYKTARNRYITCQCYISLLYSMLYSMIYILLYSMLYRQWYIPVMLYNILSGIWYIAWYVYMIYKIHICYIACNILVVYNVVYSMYLLFFQSLLGLRVAFHVCCRSSLLSAPLHGLRCPLPGITSHGTLLAAFLSLCHSDGARLILCRSR